MKPTHTRESGPDPHPTVREGAPKLGDLSLDFDFGQPPRQPLILNPHPAK